MKVYYIRLRLCILSFLCMLAVACNQSSLGNKTEEEISYLAIDNGKQEVKTAKVQKDVFWMEIHCNGKLSSTHKADIAFPFPELIREIPVNNGDHVMQGQVLARLEEDDLRRKLLRAKEMLEKATLDLDDKLIDYGYRLADSIKVPDAILTSTKVKSGYNNAVYEYQSAAILLNKSVIKAPFSGKIANMEARIHNSSSAFTRLCTLINDDQLTVTFGLLETELQQLSDNARITVFPLGDTTGDAYFCHTIRINPLVDKDGLVQVTGIANNTKRKLIDGMNVKVMIGNPLKDRLIVPITAVVNRQEREVVFTLDNNKAKWHYVKTAERNSRYVVIREGLKPGENAIISNNLHLANGTVVTTIE